MTSQSATPETIDKLADGVTYALAMLAGMQLDAWTPLKDGPRTAEQIASSLNGRAFKIRPLLKALTAAGLLTFAARSGDYYCRRLR